MSVTFVIIFLCISLELVISSAASKMVAATVTYPHEVVRSRMHVSGVGAFSGLWATCRQIYAEDGVAAFYRGCMTNLLRTTPAAAVTFTTFELISRALTRWAEGEQKQQHAPVRPPMAALTLVNQTPRESEDAQAKQELQGLAAHTGHLAEEP